MVLNFVPVLVLLTVYFFSFGQGVQVLFLMIFVKLIDALAVVIIGKVISCSFSIDFSSVYFVGLFRVCG